LDIFVTIISVLGALIIIGIIIMVHELGHYSVGRACRIKIVEFAVGFGPKIKSWVKNDIIYSIRWIFLGGFTKFYGEDEDLNDKLAFNNQPAGRRALTIAAGPVFNIMLAFLLAIFALTCFGEFVPTIGEVWEGSPAEAAGLEAGDVIVEMNGVDTDFYMQTQTAIDASDNTEMTITVNRQGEMKSFIIPYQYYEEYDKAMVGISFGAERVHFGFFEAIAVSFKWTFYVLKQTLVLFLGLFAGKGLENTVGLPGMIRELSVAVKSSPEYLLQLCAAINASLAIANLLPLPALDGGRLVFIGIEKVRRKPVPRNVEGMIHFVGFVLLFGVMILFVFRDFANMFGG
jgi:regulator of sigma E protease